MILIENGGPRRTRTAAADRLRPADYASDGLGREWAVTRRKVTGFSDGVGQGDRNRAYAEIGGGQYRAWLAVSGRAVRGF